MKGVQHQPKFDDLWDHWAWRILLYRLYCTQDETEKELAHSSHGAVQQVAQGK